MANYPDDYMSEFDSLYTQPEMVSFLARLSPELYEAVEETARREDRSMASVVRQALRNYIEGCTSEDLSKCLLCGGDPDARPHRHVYENK